MDIFTTTPKIVARYLDMDEHTICRKCQAGELEAEFFGVWKISVPGLKRKYWRLGPDYWRKVIYDYHSGDQRTAESEYQEFLRIYEEERKKLETDTKVSHKRATL